MKSPMRAPPAETSPRSRTSDRTPENPAPDISFTALELPEPLLAALAHLGYETPTPIQVETIPPLLAGRDVIGQAQTGTGKTHTMVGSGGQAGRVCSQVVTQWPHLAADKVEHWGSVL
mgnify:CR=1 FL=1